MKRWKKFALAMPGTYLFICCTMIGLAGAVLRFPRELTALMVMGAGYLLNLIWMFRLEPEKRA